MAVLGARVRASTQLLVVATLLAASLLVPRQAEAATLVTSVRCTGIASTYVSRINVYTNKISIRPTTIGRYTRRSTMWWATNRCAPSAGKAMLARRTIRDQFDCHTVWDVYLPGHGWTAGPTWDLETYRRATRNQWTWYRTGCNW